MKQQQTNQWNVVKAESGYIVRSLYGHPSEEAHAFTTLLEALEFLAISFGDKEPGVELDWVTL